MTPLPGESATSNSTISLGTLQVAIQSEIPHLAEALKTTFSGASAPVCIGAKGSQSPTSTIFEVRQEATSSDGPLTYLVARDGNVLYRNYREEALVPCLEWAITDAARRSLAGYHLLHAGAVARNGRGILLPGRSGAGKSTVVAALALQGFEYCSDELAVVGSDARLRPFPKAISLKLGGWRKITRQFPDAVAKAWTPSASLGISGGGIWYVKPPSLPDAQRAQDGYPVDFVLIPHYEGDPGDPLLPIPKSQALKELIEQSIDLQIWGAPGLDLLVRMVQGAQCYSLATNDLPAAVRLVGSLTGP